MHKNVLLPFEDCPYLQMYHNYAFPMGIIQGNSAQDITPWLCTRNINCCFDKKNENHFSISVEDTWPTADRILIRQSIDLYPELFEALYPNIVTLFRKMLSSGVYAHGSCNEEYIPGKRNYQKKYYAHDFLLIGYDDINQHFISVGYLADGKFQRFTIPYENMQQSIETLMKPKFAYSFWTYNQSAAFVLKMDRVLSDMQDYITSKASFPKAPQNKEWGISAIEMLAEYFIETAQTDFYIDNRYTRGFMEHQFLMHMRINYFYQQEYIDNPNFVERARENYRLAERVHLLAIKYNMTKKETIITKICEAIHEVVENEKYYLPKVLYCLQTCKKVEK